MHMTNSIPKKNVMQQLFESYSENYKQTFRYSFKNSIQKISLKPNKY